MKNSCLFCRENKSRRLSNTVSSFTRRLTVRLTKYHCSSKLEELSRDISPECPCFAFFPREIMQKFFIFHIFRYDIYLEALHIKCNLRHCWCRSGCGFKCGCGREASSFVAFGILILIDVWLQFSLNKVYPANIRQRGRSSMKTIIELLDLHLSAVTFVCELLISWG